MLIKICNNLNEFIFNFFKIYILKYIKYKNLFILKKIFLNTILILIFLSNNYLLTESLVIIIDTIF